MTKKCGKVALRDWAIVATLFFLNILTHGMH